MLVHSTAVFSNVIHFACHMKGTQKLCSMIELTHQFIYPFAQPTIYLSKLFIH